MFVRLLHGNCLERLLELEDESVDAFVKDPPYDLTATPGAAPSAGGFMNKLWDSTGISFNVDFWRLVSQKLKPNGLVKSFGATRTYHRMVRAVRRSGLKVERLHAWTFASGFPKSTNISKRIDRMAKAERKVVGYKRGVGGENMNDLVHGRGNIKFAKGAGGAIGAYGTGAKQIPVQVPITVPATEEALLWDGYGTALKPAWEPIVIARKIG